MYNQKLPSYVIKYFWGDDVEQLNIEKNRQYIVQTILEKGDQQAVRWLFSLLDRQTIKDILSSIKMDKKSERFWEIYLSELHEYSY